MRIHVGSCFPPLFSLPLQNPLNPISKLVDIVYVHNDISVTFELDPEDHEAVVQRCVISDVHGCYLLHTEGLVQLLPIHPVPLHFI